MKKWQEQERKQERVFPDRFRDYRIRSGNCRRLFPFYTAYSSYRACVTIEPSLEFGFPRAPSRPGPLQQNLRTLDPKPAPTPSRHDVPRAVTPSPETPTAARPDPGRAARASCKSGVRRTPAQPQPAASVSAAPPPRQVREARASVWSRAIW